MGDDDKVNRILRGNTDHDPKPDFASRRDATPRGLATPSLTPGGGMRPAASMRRPEVSPNTQARNESRDPPTVPRKDQDKPRAIRRLATPRLRRLRSRQKKPRILPASLSVVSAGAI